MTQLGLSVTKKKLWTEFESQARRQRRDPQKLLTDYMRECLEIWEDERLWKQLRKDAQKTGRHESEAVDIVREYRQAKKRVVPRRKDRIPVVVDTNVFVAYLLSQRQDSANARIVELWTVQRKLQLIVAPEIMDEYLGVFRSLIGVESRLKRVERQLQRRDTVTQIRLGPRSRLSRDPDDNLMLATARSGSARYLVTHDRDLLDIPFAARRTLRFEIVTPVQFLAALEVKQN